MSPLQNTYVCERISITQPSQQRNPRGDFFYQRYVSCDYSFSKPDEVTISEVHVDCTFSAQGIRTYVMSDGRTCKSGAFDIRNAPLNDFHVKITKVIEPNGDTRKPTRAELTWGELV